MTEKIYTGTIIKWNSERGFGFVRADANHRNYFIHIRAWRNDAFPPIVGQQVAFELGADDKDPDKLKAINVRLVPSVVAGVDALTAGV